MPEEVSIEEINARFDAICAQRESFANEAAVLRGSLFVKNKAVSELQARVAELEAEVAELKKGE